MNAAIAWVIIALHEFAHLATARAVDSERAFPAALARESYQKLIYQVQPGRCRRVGSLLKQA